MFAASVTDSLWAVFVAHVDHWSDGYRVTHLSARARLRLFGNVCSREPRGHEQKSL